MCSRLSTTWCAHAAGDGVGGAALGAKGLQRARHGDQRPVAVHTYSYTFAYSRMQQDTHRQV